MKKLMITLTVAGAMLATSAAHAAVIRVGVGRVRVGVRTAPIRRAYVAPRYVARPAYVAPRPVIRPTYVAPLPAVRPARPATRAAVIHHRRTTFWNAVNDALQQ